MILKELLTRDKSDEEINNFRSLYGLQQEAKPHTTYLAIKSPKMINVNNLKKQSNGLIFVQNNELKINM